MSRDYVLPDYSDKRVTEWVFRHCFARPEMAVDLVSAPGGYSTLLGAEDIVKLILGGGRSI
jgi:hypothetical protein